MTRPQIGQAESINATANLRAKVTGLACYAAVVFLTTEESFAQVVSVTKAPRPFSVVPPPTWVPGPIVTGNTRIAFTSLKSAPHAECAVTAVLFKGVNMRQEDINQNMAQLPTARDVEAELGRSYNNVKVRSISRGLLAGYPAHAIKFEFIVGTPDGERWGVMSSTTAAIAPGVSWSVACGGLGKNLADARNSYSHWQSETNNFPTNFKFN